MKLIVVRHGRTVENKKRILMGHFPGTLDKVGKSQVKKLALKLRWERIDLIYSSDLKRAVDTTKEIARYHNAPVIYTKELREQNYGRFQGMSVDALIKMSKSRDSYKFNHPQDGESLHDVRKRVKRFVLKLDKNASLSKKTLLLSTHAGVIRSLLSIYPKIPLRETVSMKTGNAGIMIIEVDGKGGKILKDKMFS